MNANDWKEVGALFDEAVALLPAQRAAFVDRACTGRPRLRTELLSLLSAHERPAAIDQPVYEAAAGVILDSESPSLDGRMLGPYVLRHEIGRGGMGVVFLADDTRLSRRVALKALPTGLARDDGRRERLKQEARAAAALVHPGIVTVYALEEIDGELYLACEFVPGRTLRSIIDSARLPISEVTDIAVQLAKALAAAHAHGVVHRDLKPENIIIGSSGVVKVLDFGIARVDTLIHDPPTSFPDAVGTPGYMAPEQVRGEGVDFRADIFAFGIVVYEMALGVNPFHADTRTEALARTIEMDPPALTGADRVHIPQALDAIVMRCLQKSPSHRYSSTTQLVTALEHLRISAPFAAPAPPSLLVSTASARWWWQLHQAAISIVYAFDVAEMWMVRRFLPHTWATFLVLMTLAAAVAADTIRLHALFTSRFYPAQLPDQRARTRWWLRICDAALILALLAAAVSIASEHQATAVLLVGAAVIAAGAALLIEPTTARAAFTD